MKKFISILLVMMMISLVGCSNSKTPDSSSETEKPTESIVDESNSTVPDEKEPIFEDDFIKVNCWGELIIEPKTDTSWEWSSLEDIAEVEMKNGNYVFHPLKEGRVIFEFLSEEKSYEIDLNVYEDMTILASIWENMGQEELEPVEIDDKDIEDIFNNIYSSVPENTIPTPLMTTPVDINDKDMMLYHFGAESFEGLDVAYISEPMMMPNAYALAILRFDNEENASAASKTLETTAPMDKWVCVSAESSNLDVIGNYVVFTMANNDIVESIKEALQTIVVE